MKRGKFLLVLYCILFCAIICMWAVMWWHLLPDKEKQAEEKIQIEMNAEETTEEVTLAEKIKEGIPLFYQWEEPWGNLPYGAGPMSETGCGPTCLSMAAMYLLQDVTLTPQWMAEFSDANGFCVPGSGSSWLLMSEGARMLGLSSVELNPVKNRVEEILAQGIPIICIMGPGDFTDEGHFIVLAGMENGRIRIHDPNSQVNSARLWAFEEIEGQIRNLWAVARS